jgi:protein-L-isoaspartate(D-aspartate) O-methyltransferase
VVTRRRDVERMVDGQIRTRGLEDERVLDAMLQVPRHVFVSEAMQHRAYEDCPLPIGEGQTISQPYIVARMMELLQLCGDETVLEIGAGSGYQTALLSLLARRVVAVERIGTLARGARQRLDALEITNAVVVQADGTLGWSDEAPYQGILIAAAAPAIPEPLLDQLDVGGRMVAPVGDRDIQDLQVLVREPDGYRVRTRGGCRFVPLLGRFGFEEI